MNENQSLKRQQALVELVRQKAQRYLKTPGVTSVGVGYRQRFNEETGQFEATEELCIQFTVAQKLTLEALQENNISPLPESFQIEDGTEVQVQVIERSFQTTYEIVSDPETELRQAELTPYEQRRSRMDPIVPGISVSHKFGTAGTVGAIVYDNKSGDPLLLSNWHVLDSSGDSASDDIVQPGPIDSSDTENNRIGRLVRSHLGLAGDCAIASIENRRFTEEILELNVVPTRVAKVSLGDTVVKSGRTTGVTFGVVTRVGVTVNINYGGVVGVREIGCFEIRPNPNKPPIDGEISKGGDSGSIWLIDGGEHETDIAVGLHFAGETNPAPSAEHALACNIHSVLDKLNVSFVDNISTLVDDEELWNEVLSRLSTLEWRLTVSQKELLRQAENTQSSPEDGLPVYGNWCGPGHGSGEPIDDVDRACMEHDKCYGRKGYFDCGCDAQLLEDLARSMKSSKISPSGRAAALAISTWFSAQPCVTRVGGIPVPMGTGATTLILNQQVKLVRRAGKKLWKKIRSLWT